MGTIPAENGQLKNLTAFRSGEHMQRKCENCQFWQSIMRLPLKDGKTFEEIELGEGRPGGNCRRFPPIQTHELYEVRNGFDYPATYHDDWCGEWRPKDDTILYADGSDA
jgi:hypothetical protein